MKKIFFLGLTALVLRLTLAPLTHHGDADSIFFWGKYLWEKKDFLSFLGKAVPDAMPAIYPPIFYYLFFLWRGLYDVLGRFLWFLNIKIAIFPSNFIFWYQGHYAGVGFNKLPAIFSDFGCAFLIYKIAKIIGVKENQAKLSSWLFLLLPAAWYNSAYWGQMDSLYSVFILLAFYLALKDKLLLGTFSLAVSALIKPTGLFVLPVFLAFALKKKRTVDFFLGGIFSLALAWVLYFPFQPLKTIPWAVEFYFKSFRGELAYLVSNAFNLWTFLFGFDQRPANSLFLGISLSFWGFLIFSATALLIVLCLWRRPLGKQFIIASFLCGFAAFLFLPRMHERYFYTALVFLAPLSGLGKKWLYSLVILSLIHFINLYHYWWYPKIPLFISIFSNLTVIRGIIVLSLLIFAWSLNCLFQGKLND